MNNPFEILARFLAQHRSEVEGRALEKPPTEIITQVRDFVRGQLPEAERGEFFRRLKDRPEWISALAEEARSARPPAPSGK